MKRNALILFLLCSIVLAVFFVLFKKVPLISKPSPIAPEKPFVYGVLRKYVYDSYVGDTAVDMEPEGYHFLYSAPNATIADTKSALTRDISLDLATYEGKCVKIIQPDILAALSTSDYPHILFDNIELVDFSLCPAYDNENYPSEYKEVEEFDGTLARMIRDYPDIPFDYELALNETYMQKDTAAGFPLEVDSILVEPLNSSIWEKFENSVDTTVHVKGFWKWSYAETRIFVVEELSVVL